VFLEFKKTKIWTSATIIFHWFLAIGFSLTYWLGLLSIEFDEIIHFHFSFGFFTTSLIFFRIIFGFIGPKYILFKDFPLSFKKQMLFIKEFFRSDSHIGHNPAASFVMILIFSAGLLCGITGYLKVIIETGKITNIDEDILKYLHKNLADAFLVLVFIHLTGVLNDIIFHWKNRTFTSIFNGYKRTVGGNNVKLTTKQKVFTVVWFSVSIIAFFYGLSLVQII